jgi:2-polyprenyl-3-methyl-5-hydroxy-6-metoxy-1,4-benzoquinol methylase
MRDIKDYTDKYSGEPFESTMVEIRKKTVIEQCNKYNHKNILEIGCGMKPFFVDFKDYDNMVIVEPGEAFTENARKIASKENKRIEIISGSLEERVKTILSLGIEFDLIILSSVLHELDDPQRMLASIKELCSEGTVVHINVPNANSMHRLIAIEAGLINDVHEQSDQMKKMQRRRTYDMKLLKGEVEQAGFMIDGCGSYFVKPFTHLQMQRCIDEEIIDEKVLLGLEGLVKYMPEFGAGIYVNVKKNYC